MRNTLILFALLCGALVWMAIAAAAPKPEPEGVVPIVTAKAPTILTRTEFIQGVRNREGQYTPHRQALAMASLMIDTRGSKSDVPTLPVAQKDIAYWPLTSSDLNLWPMSRNLPRQTQSQSMYLAEQRSLITLAVGGVAIDPVHIADWFDEQARPEVPQEVWEARALLRPMQISSTVPGSGPGRNAAAAYQALRLVPNRAFCERLDDHFDRVEFFTFRREGIKYGLLLTRDNKAWLWGFTQAMHNHPGEFALELFTDAEALKLTDIPPVPEHQDLSSMMQYPHPTVFSYGKLDDLLRDAPVQRMKSDPGP